MAGHGPLTRAEVLLALVCEMTQVEGNDLIRYYVPTRNHVPRWCELLRDHVPDGEAVYGDSQVFSALRRRGLIAFVESWARHRHAFRSTEKGAQRYANLRAKVAASGGSPCGA